MGGGDSYHSRSTVIVTSNDAEVVAARSQVAVTLLLRLQPTAAAAPERLSCAGPASVRVTCVRPLSTTASCAACAVPPYIVPEGVHSGVSSSSRGIGVPVLEGVGVCVPVAVGVVLLTETSSGAAGRCPRTSTNMCHAPRVS